LTAVLVFDLVADIVSLAHFKRRSSDREAGEKGNDKG
jgi:hypothetical protein